jgi:hypothetical protein
VYSLEKEGFEVSLKPPENYPRYTEKSDVQQAQNLKTSCTLYKLPFEIRDRIFELTLNWTGETPSMLIALRQDPILINHYVLTLCSHIDLHPIIHVLCGNKLREVVRGKIHDWNHELA